MNIRADNPCPYSNKGKTGSALIIILAMIVFLSLLALAFSRLMVVGKVGIENTIDAPRVFYIAQAGLEFAIRFARDNPQTWEKEFTKKLSDKGFNREFGGGKFYLSYDKNSDQLISWARFNSGIRAVSLDNFGAKWAIDKPPYFEIIDYFIQLIDDYYKENGRYPRSWYPYNYTDLGLDPDDWVDGRDGIVYKPNGDELRIEPVKHYTFYVNDFDGNTRELRWNFNWDLVYSMEKRIWYYHDILAGNEVDIDTLIVEYK